MAAAPAVRAVIRAAKSFPKTKGGWRVDEALQHLAAADPRLVPLMVAHGPPTLYAPPHDAATPPFHALLRTIVYQQLNGSVAAKIFDRVLGALGVSEGSFATPEQVQCGRFVRAEQGGKTRVLLNGRASGLSWSKATYAQSLAEHFLDPARLGGWSEEWPDEELFRRLLAVKGLGAWSVHMYMLFRLHKPNVLATGDLAVRRGVAQLHGRGDIPATRQGFAVVEELARPWRPYASVGCWYMWRSQDTTVAGADDAAAACGRKRPVPRSSGGADKQMPRKKEKTQKLAEPAETNQTKTKMKRAQNQSQNQSKSKPAVPTRKSPRRRQ